MSYDQEITRLLVQWKDGNEAALQQLVPLVYQELRLLARSYLRRERRDHTLQATALVHELFVRLAKDRTADWTDRSHFFGVAARVMRQILVSHARRHGAQKRGGGANPVDAASIAEPAVPEPADSLDLDALDAALSRLAERDSMQAKIVELRFFGGYTIEETAALVGRSPATVSREWKLARMWLHHETQRGRV